LKFNYKKKSEVIASKILFLTSNPKYRCNIITSYKKTLVAVKTHHIAPIIPFIQFRTKFRKSFSPKPACLAVTENDFRLTNIFTFDPEMIFHPHFHFKSFPKKEREKREPRSRRSSDDRTAPTSDAIAIVDRAARRTIAAFCFFAGFDAFSVKIFE